MSIDRLNRPLPMVLRRGLREGLAPVLRRYWRLEVDRPERLPSRRAPLILACNHASYLDTLVLAVAIRARFVVCGAKPRLFRTRGRRALLQVANVLKVEDHDQYLEDCTTLLAGGSLLLTYPEMGRNPEQLGSFSTWPAEVALTSGVELLPLYLYGMSAGHHGALSVRVGERLQPVGEAEELTARLREAIVSLGER